MNRKCYFKIMCSCIFIVIHISSVFSQDEHVLNPKNYLSEKKINRSIHSISELRYIPITDDEAMEYDTIIVFGEEEHTLKLKSFSLSKFESSKETVSHFDSKKNKRTIWTHEYDDQGNLICSILNHKEKQNKIKDWANIENGFKYCQSYDEKNRITKSTQQDGRDSIQINSIINYRKDGLISSIHLGFPWGEIFQVFQAKDIGDTIRYIQSYEQTKLISNKNDAEIANRPQIILVDLVKEKENYIFYQKEIDRKSNKSRLVEKQFFDQEWNIKEIVKYENDEINFHKMYVYNDRNQLIEVKNSLNNDFEIYKYDDLGNLIYFDNNYLLIYKKYDDRNNRIMDFKIYKDSGLLKEVTVREITYREY